MGFIIIVRTPVLFLDTVLHARVDFTLSWTTLVVSIYFLDTYSLAIEIAQKGCGLICFKGYNAYKICEQPRVTVSQVKMDPSSITFTRWLLDDLRMNWDNIMKDIYDFQLVDDKDLVT